MTLKQQLINTGLFIERGGFLLVEETSMLMGEVNVEVTAKLRFNSAGELTEVLAYASSVGSAPGVL